jgi:hypothetical protein
MAVVAADAVAETNIFNGINDEGGSEWAAFVV